MVTYLNGLITEKLSIREFNSITIACIGTDRVTGDSLGPIVGEILEQKKWENVSIIGNLENPLHAKNLIERLESIPDDSLIIAVDACLGRLDSLNCISINNESVHPGAALDKGLPSVGDISILGTVNLSNGGFSTLQYTRLYTVIELAKGITNIISEVIPYVNFTESLEEIIA
ncbi:spore protease YyaC [Clostridium lacusfryxellense]|nr:spore protease YyaC [Clostridium lacusfryxellense]